jgi:uncharacterized protein (DUF169 family)
MALPAARDGGVAMSLGCVGNRIYTDLAEDELHVALPGREVPRVAAELGATATANAALADYRRGRRVDLATD